WKAKGVDVSALLQNPSSELGTRNPELRCVSAQDHGLDEAIDYHLIETCRAALDDGDAVEISGPIRNSNRTVGTMLSGEVAKRYGEEGLPDDTIRIHFLGSAGQSF